MNWAAKSYVKCEKSSAKRLGFGFWGESVGPDIFVVIMRRLSFEIDWDAIVVDCLRGASLEIPNSESENVFFGAVFLVVLRFLFGGSDIWKRVV